MKLSRTVAYAVHAMLLLARQEGTDPVPCNQLARAGNMPERFLLQILRSLVTHGLLISTRGAEGGYSLARPAEDIALIGIFDACEEPVVPSVPKFAGVPNGARLELQVALSKAHATARKQLEAITLADLLRAGEPAQRRTAS